MLSRPSTNGQTTRSSTARDKRAPIKPGPPTDSGCRESRARGNELGRNPSSLAATKGNLADAAT